MKRVLALSLLLALAACGVASAQGTIYYDRPLSDFKARGSLAIGANYEWNSPQGAAEAPTFAEEVTAGLYGAYNLVPKLSAVGSLAYGFDNEFLRTALGVNHQFYDGEVDLGVAILYEWVSEQGVGVAPPPSKEFTIGLRAVNPVNKWLIAAGSSAYGLDTKCVRTSLGLRVAMFR